MKQIILPVTIHLNIRLPLALLQPESADAPTGPEPEAHACQGCGNCGAIKIPELITEAAHRYGDLCGVLSMDVKRVGDEYHVFKQGGRVDTGIDALEWAESGVRRGAGELVVNSIDTDGVKLGFDIPMLLEIAKRVDVPIIASGGAGKKEDFLDLFQYPQIDAGLAASIFHRKEVNIKELKQYLAENGVEMRLI